MTDAEPQMVFVNERMVRVPAPATALAAVRALDPALADLVAAGRARLTDGRGLPCDPDAPVAPGAILRAAVSARRPGEPDADA
jgi:hypothetical protein